MYFILRLISVLITINQETVLKWFDIEDPRYQDFASNFESYGIATMDEVEIPASPEISLETFRLVINGLWDKVLSGLSLTEIEDVILILAFVRFIYLLTKYNIKTSFYISCIGLASAYLWYRHLIDLTLTYRGAFSISRITRVLGHESVSLSYLNRAMRSRVGFHEGTASLNPLGALRFALVQASTKGPYRIDPISMIFANIPEPLKSTYTDNIYYFIYRDAGPWIYKYCQREASVMSALVAYTYLTRIQKKYCPYLVRWHWTFIIILDFVERPFFDLVHRLTIYLKTVLLPETKALIARSLFIDTKSSIMIFEYQFVRAAITTIIICHIGFVLFGLLHALFGQYFYFPFLTENTEIHIGPRDPNSVYSGGHTAWQDRDEKNKLRRIPKLWYGWFGRGTKENIINELPGVRRIRKSFKKLRKRFLKKLRKRFRL